MGWGSGNGKAEVLNPASGDLIACGSDGDHPFAGKLVFIDVSGLAHKAAKKDSVVVAREGKSLSAGYAIRYAVTRTCSWCSRQGDLRDQRRQCAVCGAA